MGNSHYTSDFKAANIAMSGINTITATSVTAPTITSSGTVSGAIVALTSYIKMGSHQYIFFGHVGTDANIVALATAVDASCQGSLYVSGQGKLYLFTSDTAATSLAAA